MEQSPANVVREYAEYAAFSISPLLGALLYSTEPHNEENVDDKNITLVEWCFYGS